MQTPFALFKPLNLQLKFKFQIQHMLPNCMQLLGQYTTYDTNIAFNYDKLRHVCIASWKIYARNILQYYLNPQDFHYNQCRTSSPMYQHFFLAFDFCRFCMVIRVFSSSQPQQQMTSDFEGFSIPDFIHYICFPILTNVLKSIVA